MDNNIDVTHQKDPLPPDDIPELSTLHAQAETAMIVRVIGGGGSVDHIAYTLQLNCIRLTDAAIRDYSLGRHAILEFHACRPENFGIGYITQASTHFESCVWHMERFIKHVKALRSYRYAEKELKALTPKDLTLLKHSSEQQITKLRHTLVHLEKDALQGKLPQGTHNALLATKEGLSIAHHLVTWDELVSWLREAHTCVQHIARFVPTSEETT